jgi:hypothetical protein
MVSPKRGALMALQAWRNHRETEAINNYVDFLNLTDEEIDQRWLDYCVGEIDLATKSAATTAQLTGRLNGAALAYQQIKAGASLIEWVALLHAHCWVGINITEFARLVTDIEHVRMIVAGSYDIGMLLGLEQECVVPTGKDHAHIHNIIERTADNTIDDTKLWYRDRWIPATGSNHTRNRIFRMWRHLFGRESLLQLLDQLLPAEVCAKIRDRTPMKSRRSSSSDDEDIVLPELDQLITETRQAILAGEYDWPSA